jgi:bisphosphoglycerate-dependent phosphoglycerate mutase
MSETDTAPRLRLYLIRHGEIEHAAMGKLIGQTDVALSKRGVEQARRLAEKLSSVRVDAVYSSDLRRARLTAEIIAERNRVSARLSAAWREIDMGAVETGDWQAVLKVPLVATSRDFVAMNSQLEAMAAAKRGDVAGAKAAADRIVALSNEPDQHPFVRQIITQAPSF